jgi:hypothetical protein
MKNFLSTCCACLFVCFSFGQVQIAVTADQVSIPSSQYAQLDAILGGSGQIVCYRLYAEFPAGFQLASIYGSSLENAPFNLNSGNTFYQNPNGAAVAFDLVNSGSDPLLQFDSWLTIGAEDSLDASNYSSTFVLESTPFFDNFELGYDVAVDTANLLFDEASLFAVNDFDVNGNLTSNLNQPDANGRVLIGQLTARQFVGGCMTFNLTDIIQETYVSINQTVCFSFSPEFVSADFNTDGFVDTQDLTLILTEFGCLSGCNTDLTGDNRVTVADLISFIYYWSPGEIVE